MDTTDTTTTTDHQWSDRILVMNALVAMYRAGVIRQDTLTVMQWAVLSRRMERRLTLEQTADEINAAAATITGEIATSREQVRRDEIEAFRALRAEFSGMVTLTMP